MTATVEQLILDLADQNLREKALLDLSKKRDNVPNLALLLWNSFGTIAILIQELVSIYPYLSPPTLTSAASNRVCNALALLQCVASHDGTRHLLLNAQIPLYLYPFLNPKSQAKQFEYLRLTSMGVIGALVKVDDPAIIHFLLHTQIIPLCLQTMEVGGELSKTVATFIVQKILMDDGGLRYICDTQERFFAVASVLGSLARSHRDENHARRRLLKHIVRCFRRLADNERAREALRNLIPQLLQHPNLSNYLSEDQEIGLLFEDLMRYLLRGS